MAVASAAQTATPVPLQIVLGDAQLVSTAQQRHTQGFEFGYVDGVMGGVKGPNGYQFYGSAKSAFFSCSLGGSTPLTQGVYALSAPAADPTHNFSARCKALLMPSGKNPGVLPTKGPIVITGPYDRDSWWRPGHANL